MSPEFGMDTGTSKTIPAQSTELDQIVAQTSLSIVDDYPSADPRWAESKSASMFFFVFLYKLIYLN